MYNHTWRIGMFRGTSRTLRARARDRGHRAARPSGAARTFRPNRQVHWSRDNLRGRPCPSAVQQSRYEYCKKKIVTKSMSVTFASSSSCMLFSRNRDVDLMLCSCSCPRLARIDSKAGAWYRWEKRLDKFTVSSPRELYYFYAYSHSSCQVRVAVPSLSPEYLDKLCILRLLLHLRPAFIGTDCSLCASTSVFLVLFLFFIFICVSTMAILSQEQLNGLDAHVYSCTGRSLLEPIFQPFWNWLVTLLPLWLAPNLVTFLGLLVNIGTSVVVFLCSPHMTEPVSLIHISHLLLSAVVVGGCCDVS